MAEEKKLTYIVIDGTIGEDCVRYEKGSLIELTETRAAALGEDSVRLATKAEIKKAEAPTE